MDQLYVLYKAWDQARHQARRVAASCARTGWLPAGLDRVVAGPDAKGDLAARVSGGVVG